MNKQSNKSEILSTDGGKTKSNAIEIPSIELPKGGGALKGIDEKFSVNAVNGTSSFAVPLPFSPSRGLTPSLNLSYNSGGGNGIFGLGWSCNISSIKRKTDKELPRYFDEEDSDTFLFSDTEDLVPEFSKDTDGIFITDTDGNYVINEHNSPDGLFLIRYYKPRTEGMFARIERWTEKASGEIKWRVTTKDNVTTLFGWSNNSRIANPQDRNKVYEWLVEFVFDDKGNTAHYIYKEEDIKGIDQLQIHNKNRIDSNGLIKYTNRYLEKVLYGNKTPYKQLGDAFPFEDDYMFSTVFDYGEYNTLSPYDKINDWNYRNDTFSDYKPGFEIRTTRLCNRVLTFHHFDEYEGLVKSLNFTYDTDIEQDFTFLTAITSYGYIKKTDGSYSHKKLPPMEFGYQKHEWSKEIKSVNIDDLVNAPVGLDESAYQFTDLYNEGLNGILTEQAKGWYYKHNLGNGAFTGAKQVTQKPSYNGLGNKLQLADLDGDGGKQFVSYDTDAPGFFEMDNNNEWQNFRVFKNLPNVNFKDSNARMLDLDGDGKAELVFSEEQYFSWFKNEGREGFSEFNKTAKPLEEEQGANIIFSDATQSVFLSNMSGSGLTDIVRIKNGEICYWPNLGYGRFGAKVTMDNAPVFDYEDAFNLLRVQEFYRHSIIKIANQQG